MITRRKGRNSSYPSVLVYLPPLHGKRYAFLFFALQIRAQMWLDAMATDIFDKWGPFQLSACCNWKQKAGCAVLLEFTPVAKVFQYLRKVHSKVYPSALIP